MTAMGEEVPFKEKIKTIGFSRASHRAPKVTVDKHTEHRQVEVTEHWHDRVDVKVKNPEVTLAPGLEEHV